MRIPWQPCWARRCSVLVSPPRPRARSCLPSFLVIGTQKGGTSSFHWLLKEGWHNRIQVCHSRRCYIPGGMRAPEVFHARLNVTCTFVLCLGQQRREGDPLLLLGRYLPQGPARLPACTIAAHQRPALDSPANVANIHALGGHASLGWRGLDIRRHRSTAT